MERIRLPGKAPRRDSPSDDSPPRTPPSQTSRAQTIKQDPQTRPSLGDAFPDEMFNGADTANSSNESGDERDPHDLSLSPKHAARTSIVDNMLMSLDQFSAGTSVLDDYRLFHSVLEPDSYNRNSQDSTFPGRYRGHTFSSSLSSETDPAYNEGVSHYGIQTASGRRSNSSSNYPSSLRGTGSLRRYERGQAGGSSSLAYRTRKGSKSSVSSTLDFGPPLSRNRADSGSDGHSASIDYEGKTTPFPPFPEDDYKTMHDDELDAAPTPSVPAGPRKFQSPSPAEKPSSLNPQPSMTSTTSRKNSVRSSPHSNAPKRKPRPENIGTAAIGRTEPEVGLEPPPALGGSLDPPAPSPTISFNKPSFPPPPPEPNPPKERPSFFRRVFGSSKNSTPDDHSYPAQDHDSIKGGKQSSKNDTSVTNTLTRQVVNKKSSFFRRRKKSVVDSVPPPITLPPHLAQRALDTAKPKPSPVGSLRQVMNPYLADAVAPANRSSKEYHGREPSVDDTDPIRSASLASQKKRGNSVPPTSGSRSKLGANPTVSSGGLETSLPATSSGDEASTAKSIDVGGSPLSSPARGKDADADSPGSPTQNKLAPPPPPSISVPPTTLSPVVEDFPHKTSPYTESPAEAPEVPKPPKLSSPGEESVMSGKSNYFTASNTPVIEEFKSTEPSENKVEEGPEGVDRKGPTTADREQAQKLFDSQDEVVGNEPAAAWLGDPDRATIREAYMDLFDWSNMHILAGLRSLCGRLVLKGETQQVDRVLDAFSTRWCRCNPNHGFKAAGWLASPVDFYISNLCFRCGPYDLLLSSSVEHRPSSCRYRSEDDQTSIRSQHLANDSSGCGRCSTGRMRDQQQEPDIALFYGSTFEAC